MAPVLSCLPSPLLGPAVWEPVAPHLRRHGYDVLVASSAVAPTTPEDVLTAFTQQLPPRGDVVLIPHSNAGLYAPALTQVAHVSATVFVDAGVPPERGSVQLAPTALVEWLTVLADVDGTLPPWTQWWDDVGELFPDDKTRAAVESEQQRLPVGYFRSSMSVPDGWAAHPCAYIAFGETYAAERERALELGWPIRTLPGRHLHTVVDPGAVAAAIHESLQQLSLHP